MAAGPLAHGFRVAGAVGAAGGIAHGPLRVVHRSGHLADERNRRVVADLIDGGGAPFHLLQSVHPFEIQHVRPGAVQTGRLVRPVQVEHQPMAGGRLGDAVVEGRRQLVIAVHEVDLEPLDPHGGVVGAHPFHVAVEGPVAGPEDDADPFSGGVTDDLGQVDLGIDLHQVLALLRGPAVVQNHVFDPQAGGEVDVVLIGGSVDARAEIHARDIPVVPPVPGHLARADPRDVVDARGGCHQIAQVARRHLDVRAHYGDAPRKGPRLRHFGNVVGGPLHPVLDVVVAARHDRGGAGCELALESRVPVAVAEVEARVVDQVGLGDADANPVARRYRKRQKGQPAGIQPGERRRRIGVFERVVILALPIAVRTGLDVRHGRLEIVRKTVLHPLVHDVEGLADAADEAVAHAVVVGPELHRPAAFHFQDQGVVPVMYLGRTIEGRGVGRVDACAPGPLHPGIPAPDGAVVQLERQCRGLHHRPSVEGEVVGQLFARRDGRSKPSGGGAQRVSGLGLQLAYSQDRQQKK